MEWNTLFQHVVPQLEVLILVILIDFVMGVAASLKNHTFDPKKLPDVLAHYGLRIIGWLGLELLAVIPEQYLVSVGLTTLIGDGALTLIIISALGSIIKSAKELGIMPSIKNDQAPVE